MIDGDTINDALIELVKALGGSKQVGHRLWPEKAVDAAQRHLLACLNEDKAERLSPEQLVLLMRMGHERGHNEVMAFFARSVGYSKPVAVAPRDAAADLRRQYIEAARMMAKMAERIEQLDGVPFAKVE